MIKRIFIILCLPGYLLVGALSAQAAELDWSKAFRNTESVFSDLNSSSAPGCAVGVVHEGNYIFAKGYGMANLEHNVPIGSSTVFDIASVSKQFTAAAIAILAERGEIDLDADIHKYLADLADYGATVTIRQIIHHISGIPDYEEYGAPFLNASGDNFRFGDEDYYRIQEFYDRVKTLPLEKDPETEFSYSNTGYFLLSKVVEHVTHMSLRDFAEKEIFIPLGMQQTFFMDNAKAVVPNKADGYKYLDDGGFERFTTNLDWVGDGGLHTSLEDFIRWDQNFYGNKLGKESSEFIKLLETPPAFFDDTPPADTFPGGALSPYAWGMFIMKYRGLKAIGHTGGWVGYRSYYVRFPEVKLSFVIMCNADTHSRTAQRINAIRDSYLDVLGVSVD